MTPVPAAAGHVSAIDAARDAIDHTRRHLFPFRFERWLALGFLAFLDQCGRGGQGAPGGGPWGGGGDGGKPDLSGVAAWIAGHVGLIVAIAAAALTVMLVVTALVLWVNSRGIFMYLDNVATGRFDVARPWSEHAERAGSLFAWRFAIAAGTLLGVLSLLVLGAVVVLGFATRRVLGPGTLLVVLAPLMLLLLTTILAVSLVSMALRDFVAPLQLEAGLACGDAVRVFVPLVRAHPGAFALYVLLKMAFSMAAGIAVLLACCACCLVIVPVVLQTALQPIFYFERAWSLCLLRQLGHDLTREPARA